MGTKIKRAICTNCKKEYEYNAYVSMGKYCSNKCQNTYQSEQKIANGTAGWALLKKYLKSISDGKCTICKIDSWLGKPIMLITDHIDGNSENNDLTNLRLICSNCDATLDTYKSRNRGKGRAIRKERYTNGLSF